MYINVCMKVICGLRSNLLRKTVSTTTFNFQAEEESVCINKKNRLSVNSTANDLDACFS